MGVDSAVDLRQDGRRRVHSRWSGVARQISAISFCPQIRAMSDTMTQSESKTQLLNAERLAADPRVAEAKRLLLQAVRESSARIGGIRPADPNRASFYQRWLDEFGKLRGGNLYFPYLASGLGNGPFVELADGSVKLDFITGIGVHGFGHSDLRLVESGIDAALCDTLMQGNLQQGMESFELVKLLVDLATESGSSLQHCFLSSSGAMANENSLKIAFQRNAPADRVLAFEGCFAGRTLALAAITDKAAYRVGLPRTLEVDLLPFYDASRPAESTSAAVAQMRHHLHRFPKSHACLWMELIQGEGGYYPGDTQFFRALIDLAREHDIAVIVDEVQSFGRTTRPFAFQHFALDPWVDIVTIGKISQVCATLYRPEYKPQPGLISQTFTASSFAILGATTILKNLLAGGQFGAEGRNQQLHRRFASELERIAGRHDQWIQGPFGIGAMIAFTPGDGSAETGKEMVKRLYDAGVMSFTAGSHPTRVRFLMPLGCTQFEHIDLACQIIDGVVADMRAVRGTAPV
jgi:acetylornithine aminotransferase